MPTPSEEWGISYHRLVDCTIGEVAEAQLGKEAVFDYAVPQSWFDDCLERGLNPHGHIVWVYAEFAPYGVPWPITRRGIEILAIRGCV